MAAKAAHAGTLAKLQHAPVYNKFVLSWDETAVLPLCTARRCLECGWLPLITACPAPWKDGVGWDRLS